MYFVAVKDVNQHLCVLLALHVQQVVLRDRSLNMGGGGGPEDFQGGSPIFSQASKGGALSFSGGQ